MSHHNWSNLICLYRSTGTLIVVARRIIKDIEYVVVIDDDNSHHLVYKQQGY
jgi:hypothetical protein